MQADSPGDFPNSSVSSPFADTEGHVIPRGRKKNALPWVISAFLLLATLGVGGFFLWSHLNDPLRTLEPFPVAKYLDNYKALAGSKFRGDLRVENDLGWKDGTGRLMAFSLRSDPRLIVVLIPPPFAQTYFTKGQNYSAELEVREGGLIYANSIRKN